MKLSHEDQKAVLLRARAMLDRPEGWKNRGRPNYQKNRRYNDHQRLTLGQACHQAAFELGLTDMKNGNTYTVALATGLLKHLERWDHRSLAGFNDDPRTRKTQLMALVDRRLLDLL